MHVEGEGACPSADDDIEVIPCVASLVIPWGPTDDSLLEESLMMSPLTFDIAVVGWPSAYLIPQTFNI